jgi:hypothetical protein
VAQYDGKIFGIGFYKTGTTTLFEALRVLGYHTVNGDKPGSYAGADDGATLIRQIDAGDFRLPTFDLFDAFTDNPYFRIWRQIHDLYPDARYILTVRDEEPWIASCVTFYKDRRVRPMRLWMFGSHADPSRDAASRQAWLVHFPSRFPPGESGTSTSMPRLRLSLRHAWRQGRWSLRAFACGQGCSGIGAPRNSHRRSQPGSRVGSSSRSWPGRDAKNSRTAALCAR